jgi:hypothetical protein
MATIAIKDMAVVGTTIGVNTPLLHGPEGASQTFARFDVLVSTGGYLVRAADDALCVGSDALIAGLATADASGTTSATVVYEPFIPGITLIEANLVADAAGADYTSVITNFGVAYGLAEVSGSYCLAADETGVTKAFATPLFFAAGSALGDVNARVIAVVNTSRFGRYGTAS